MTVNVRADAALSAYGVTLAVCASDARLGGVLRARALALGWTTSESSAVDLEYACASDGNRATLRCRTETIASTSDPDALADAFENHLKIELALRARDHVFVHAGVVGWVGGAILLPGRSRAGKTTLVEALVRAGADYYSDEFAILDAHGHVHPYAIPLAVRTAIGRTAVTVADLGGRAGTVPLPVTRIVITSYQATARWRPRPVSPALGLLALMDNTVAARRAPETTMPILRRAVEGATIVRSRRGEAQTVARALLAELA